VDVLELILDRARTSPDRPAAKDRSSDITYGELEQAVAELASGLGEQGVREGDRVCLHLPNSVEFLVAALACMWVGAIFVPLATTDPAPRRRAVVENCEPALVLADAEMLSVAERDGERLYEGRLVLPVTAVNRPGGAAPARADDDDRPAYCIYTSGTTALPKGVLIGHRSFLCAVLAAAELLELDETTRSLCVSSFHFDGSYGTLFPTPVAGGSLVIPRREALMLPRLFFRTVADEQVTHTSMSPTYLRLLLPSRHLPELARTPLRTMAFGGDALFADDLERLWASVPSLRVFNRYGPTETTIAVTTHELTPEIVALGDPLPIGRPHAGVTFWLVDDEGKIIDRPGDVGELYIGGNHLMIGYWREPALMSEVMRTDVVPGETVYRTRDLVFRDDSGSYHYVDRSDRVVKRSGMRISLVEITASLTSLSSISKAHCVAYDKDGGVGIAAFVVPIVAITGPELRHAARDRLPATMLPDVIEVVADFPLTGSNKVDERAMLQAAGLQELGKEGLRSG
jgi:amino acid adenylation domain-containing protein